METTEQKAPEEKKIVTNLEPRDMIIRVRPEHHVRRYTIQLLTEMLGTVAMDPELYKTYIESKRPAKAEQDDEAATVEKREEKGWTGFHKDPEKGLFILDYMLKGFLKHAGQVKKDYVKIAGLNGKIDDFVMISPRRLYIGKDKEDGAYERPLRAMTAQGPRVTLARSDYVDFGVTLTFEIILEPHPEVKWDIIDFLFEYGERNGLGQFRNGGFGRFEVVSYEELQIGAKSTFIKYEKPKKIKATKASEAQAAKL